MSRPLTSKTLAKQAIQEKLDALKSQIAELATYAMKYDEEFTTDSTPKKHTALGALEFILSDATETIYDVVDDDTFNI